jgi:DNA-binding NarL/FixJ family response regulator
MPRILIADDSSLIRPMLVATLSARADWTICGEASNGRQAVLLAFQVNPDLILIDFFMPMLSGFQAAEQILKVMPLVPIVLYTMSDNEQVEAEARKIGIRRVVAKASSASLLSALEEILGKPRQDGPLLVSNEYLEPLPGEGSASAPLEPLSKPDVA